MVNLSNLFAPYKAVMNYDNGKNIYVFYGQKGDYISINVDTCITEEEIRREANKNKKLALDSIELAKLLKKEKKLDKELENIVLSRYKERISVSVVYTPKKITIEFDGKEAVLSLQPLQAPKEELIGIFLKGAAVKKHKIKNKIADDLFILHELTIGSDNHFDYNSVLLQSDEWKEFEAYVKSVYVAYTEFLENMKLYGFNHVCYGQPVMFAHDINKVLNLDNYKVRVRDIRTAAVYNYIYDLFMVTDSIVVPNYNKEVFENTLKSFKTIWQVQHDIYTKLKPYSTENICFRIDEKGRLWLHTYSDCVCSYDAKELYEFVSKAYGFMDSKIDDEFFALHEFLSLNSVGCFRQCAKVFGKINLSNFRMICACRKMDMNETEHLYARSLEILNALSRMGLLKEWNICSDNEYEVVFKEDDIFFYESVENKKKAEETQYPFHIAINVLSKNKIISLCSDPEYVIENTKDIIAVMDSMLCQEYCDVLIDTLPKLDKKYLPLLHIVILKRKAKENMGENLYAAASNLVKGDMDGIKI